MCYKQDYILSKFSIDEVLLEPDTIIDHLCDKYDNNNTINGYLFACVSIIKTNRYDRVYIEYDDDIKNSFKIYFNFINNVPHQPVIIPTKCLIVDE